MATRLGYYVSPTKSTVVPTQRMVHLGFGIDSVLQSYFLTDKYRGKFKACRSALLAQGSASLKDLQKWVGKCNHLRMLFPANSLYTFQCRQLMATFGDEQRPLPPAALEEIKFWTFVDTFTEPVPFFFQQHVALTLYTDASGFGWGARVLLPSGPRELRDYWSSKLFSHDICSKEALAVLFALRSIDPVELFRRRVDVHVDNMGLVHAWTGMKSKSEELTSVLKEIFIFCLDHRISLKLIWVSTKENPADAPSRALDRCDSMLAPALRARVWDLYGPLAFDLMALPSNVFRSPSGLALPFYSLDPLPSSSGVNVFAQSPPAGRLYVFPPFCLICALIKLFIEWGGVEVVMVLPGYDGKPGRWESMLRPYVQDAVALCPAAAVGTLMIPSSSGFEANALPLAYRLDAFRCCFPVAPFPVSFSPVSAAPPKPACRVLIVADSMLRPLERLSWPPPLRVFVRCFSGAPLAAAIRRGLAGASASFDMVIVHAGVNDASRERDSFPAAFSSACDYAGSALRASFPDARVALSLPCVTSDDAINVRIAIVAQQLRDLALASGFGLVSNDNIRITDLSDTVHLNAAGVARLYGNILGFLRADVA